MFAPGLIEKLRCERLKHLTITTCAALSLSSLLIRRVVVISIMGLCGERGVTDADSQAVKVRAPEGVFTVLVNYGVSDWMRAGLRSEDRVVVKPVE